MPLFIRPEAEADLLQAYAWYQTQRNGLGVRFMEEVEHCIQSIQDRPESFSISTSPARRAILRRFPYALHFVISGQLISVIAAFHMARHPNVVAQRLSPDP